MELRKDYILNRWTYINESRHKKPDNFIDQSVKKSLHPKDCPFCLGHEHMTPDEKGRVEKTRGKWLIRWLSNKYPALDMAVEDKIVSDEEFFYSQSSYGIQEVIIETPDQRQMAEFSQEHLALILKVYNYRIEELSKIHQINYVLVFKNQGKEAGASILHSHAQVIGVKKIPAWIEQELRAYSKVDGCPYCYVLEKESQGERKIFENDDFLLFSPYAPRFNYEAWIFPKKHMKKMSELNHNQYFSLAEALKIILRGLEELDAPFCFYIQYGPGNNDFHWHLEILPQLNKKAGFELSGGDSIVTVSPESSAQFYKNC